MSQSCRAPAPRPKTNSSTPRSSRSSATRPCSVSLAYETGGYLGFVGVRRGIFRCYPGGCAVSRWHEIWNRVATANKLAGKYRTSLNSVTFEPEDVCFHGEFRG